MRVNKVPYANFVAIDKIDFAGEVYHFNHIHIWQVLSQLSLGKTI